MKVTITYQDTESLTKEEILNDAKSRYGNGVSVSIIPPSDEPWDLIYFALQNLLTYDQLNAYYDDGPLYKDKLGIIKNSIIARFSDELNQVIKDNEAKFT